jgi:hypothetical protein
MSRRNLWIMACGIAGGYLGSTMMKPFISMPIGTLIGAMVGYRSIAVCRRESNQGGPRVGSISFFSSFKNA